MSDVENSPLNDHESEKLNENEADSVKDVSLEDLDSKQASEAGSDSERGGAKSLNDDDEDMQEISYSKNDDEGSDDGKNRKRREKVGEVRKKVKKGDESDGDAKDYALGDSDSDDGRTKNDTNKNKKASEKGRRGKNKIDEEVVQSECKGIVADMLEAYIRDKACNTAKQPALHKIKAINNIAALLRKPQLQQGFLELQGLEYIANWLEKMPDGSMPGQTLKKKLIEIINSLPVDEEHMKGNLLGKRIFELYKNPKEDGEIKKSLKNIIDKWSRIAMRLPVDYSRGASYDDDMSSRKSEQSFPLGGTRAEKIKDIFYNPNKPYDRRELNKRVGYNYTVKPKGIDDKETKPIRNSGAPDFDKMYNDFKRKRKTLK